MFADLGEAQGGTCNKHGRLQGISADSVRQGFVRKVYALVAAQLSLTAFICILCVQGPLSKPILSFVLNNPGMYKYGTIIASFSVLIALLFNKKNHPWNLVLLGAFTVVTSFSVGIVCAIMTGAGLGVVVLQALVITAALVTGLTIYVYTSKRDFSFLGAILVPVLFAFCIFGLITAFFPGLRTGVIGMLYSCFGAVLFCYYIVFDTHRIAKKLGVDEYVEGAIQLYLDIINLFLHILDILAKMQKSKNR